MAEKEKVIICDNCNKMISSEKCQLCNKDICEKCKYDFKIVTENRGGDSGYLFGCYIPYCESCKVKINEYSRKNNSFVELRPEIVKSFVDYVRKAIVIQKLEKK